MDRRWPFHISIATVLMAAGCRQLAPHPGYHGVEHLLHNAALRPPHTVAPGEPMAMAFDPEPAPPGLTGPQPVDAYIRRALDENRLVQAARANVMALRYRIPQVTALDDPVVSNTIFPSAEYGQQTADGFMPWNLLIAQQFPWFGTLQLRGQAAGLDVQVALAELCAAQLDAVEAVKRAYYDLHFAERSEQILLQNRSLVEDFIEIARTRYETGQTSQEDVLSAEVILSDLDRELVATRQAIASARADLAQQLHVSPEAELGTLPEPPLGDVPAQIERLYRLAGAARPELQGRLAAIARDAKAVELARKRYYPDVTLGFNYGLMTAAGAVVPDAEGNDQLGMFVGFNLPVYRQKLDAAVLEAQARTVADAKLYEAERDATYRAIKDLFAQAQARRETLELFRQGILPRARQALEVAASDYQAGNVDFLTLITAWREVLQIEIQAAQFEAELGKSLASLERAVGTQLSEHPPAPAPAATPDAPSDAPPPPPEEGTGPFGQDDDGPQPDAEGEAAPPEPGDA
ncbi:TolC family protein [Tautonia sociabilis]|nr:TolC family protein [Tautonia sociabilis]